MHLVNKVGNADQCCFCKYSKTNLPSSLLKF